MQKKKKKKKKKLGGKIEESWLSAHKKAPTETIFEIDIPKKNTETGISRNTSW